MNDFVKMQIPVSPAAAEALREPEARVLAGRIVTAFLRPTSAKDDPLTILIAQLKDEVRKAGLTDEQIDAELAAYNGERRI